MKRFFAVVGLLTSRSMTGYFGAILVGLTWAGCSSTSAVPVTGIVTMNGEPVAGAAVNFSPAEPGGLPSLASTDEAGRFTLTTSTDEPGALPGKYKVTVYHAQFVGAPQADAQGNMGEGASSGIQTIWLVPERYSKFDTSGLQVEVAAGMPEVQLQLTSP